MKNKLISITIITGCIFFLLSGCKKQDNVGTPPAPVKNLKAKAGYGEVIFTWDAVSKIPADSANFLYTAISYKDSTGQVYEYKFSRYTDTAVISGLINKPYTFTVKTVGPHGAITEVTTVSVTPDLPVYITIAQTLQIAASIGAARVSWINNTGKTVVVNAAYTDGTGNVVSQSFTSSQVNGVGYVSGLSGSSPVKITATVSDESRIKSDPVVVTITPLAEIKLPKNSWTIAAFSDQEAGGEGAVNGYATAAIDDNIGTFWHSSWNEAQPPYPHWISINLGQAATISRVGLVNRQNATSGQTEIQLMGSADGTVWTDLGTYSFQQKNAEQFFAVTPQRWQYIKVVLTKGPDYYGFLAEVDLFGAM
ncbi:DUF4959 domain-containing protein [Chitinophaga sp.]|uniref:DUF4959 domain-containing protein n=1 Tax=Chitinophaga sp. TaxID=1869181 RepID=UPI002F91E6C3